MRFHGRVAADREYNGLALDDSEGRRFLKDLLARMCVLGVFTCVYIHSLSLSLSLSLSVYVGLVCA